jgi:hypothetical protein
MRDERIADILLAAAVGKNGDDSRGKLLRSIFHKLLISCPSLFISTSFFIASPHQPCIVLYAG